MGGLFKQYVWIIHLVVILFCSYFAAKIINVYVGKALEVHRGIGVLKKAEVAVPVREEHSRTDFELIVERNIFDSSTSAPAAATAETEGEKEAEYVPGREAVKTTLGIKVYGVLMVGKGLDGRSSATVGMGKGDVDVYAVRDERKVFSPGVVLVQVKPDRIEFINKGRLEYASLEDEMGKSIFGPPGEGEEAKAQEKAPEVAKKDEGTNVAMQDGKYVIDQREIDNALTNLDRLYTEIRAVPNFKDNKVVGMKVLSIKPGSVFAKLGLKRGDVLSKINGIELDVKRGFDIFNQLKNQKSFNLDLIRDGAPQTFDYEIR